jgi:hypothetical protein
MAYGMINDATISRNFQKFFNSTSDAGRTLIVSASKNNMVHADLLAVQAQITQAGGSGSGDDLNGPDAFTIAGLGTADGSDFESGATDVVYLKVQGTGTLNTTTVSGVTLAVVAVFAPRF